MTGSDVERALLNKLFAAIDGMDTERFVSCLTSDAVFRFGSASPVQGRDAIRNSVDGFFSSITGLKHRLTATIQQYSTLVCEGEVTYTRHDSSEITLPFVNVFVLENDLISHYKIYVDIAPLYGQ